MKIKSFILSFTVVSVLVVYILAVSILVISDLVVSNSSVETMQPIAGEGQDPDGLDAMQKPDFAREVLPILSNKCFVCHGPDAKKKQMKLVSYAEATKEKYGVKPINPDNPLESEILHRLHDADDPMPPEHAEKKLSANERDILTRWVKSGGEYTPHWAYALPVKNTAHDDIDDFIQASLETRKINFAEEATKSILARRVSLILTGLPPEPDMLDAYMSDNGLEAYETLVDQLLASPRYGEHQARYWLDAVRYGDTHGLHMDNRRGIYPYRDWVIQALNENLPLDDFITWQIAGDLLPEPTLEQQVATGYVRLNPSTAEGGAIEAEFQAKNNFDRVETLGTAFLGMSLLCARCHTHKYDPVPQEEYYRLMAFFNSTEEAPLDGNKYDYKPTVKAPEKIADWKTWHVLKQKAQDVQDAYDTGPKETLTTLLLSAIKITDEAPEELLDEQAPPPEEKDVQEIRYLFACDSFEGEVEGFRLDIIPDSDLKTNGIGQENDSKMVISQFKATLTTPDGKSRGLIFNYATADYSQDEFPVMDIIKPDAAKGWALYPNEGEPHHALVILDHKEIIPAGATLSFEVVQQDADQQSVHFEISAVTNLMDYSAAKALYALEETFTTTLVAKEGETRETFVLERGEYNLPQGEPLSPGIISIAGSMPEGAPQNRLGLAQWLTSPKHPLVARVLVNRVWQRTFGYGLVRTPEDFGLQGEQPTHPELLDWLAITLHDSNWDLKAMLKRMVMSQTFRQSSRFRSGINDPENRLFARGPSFRLDAEVLRDLSLWASGLLDPHMGGEGVKPYQPEGMWKALTHPGSNTVNYVQDEGSKLYRRSLYVYWKRTSPHPMMTLFDAPSREASCVRRSRSNTPLQSLALLNETQRVETARMLAERLLKEADDDKQRFDLLFKLVACRAPSTLEYNACDGLLQKMRARYEASPEDAAPLLAIGNIARDTSLNLADHAAWTQVTTMLLASDLSLLVY